MRKKFEIYKIVEYCSIGIIIILAVAAYILLAIMVMSQTQSTQILSIIAIILVIIAMINLEIATLIARYMGENKKICFDFFRSS